MTKITDILNHLRHNAGLPPLPAQEEWKVEAASEEAMTQELNEDWVVKPGNNGNNMVQVAIELDIHKRTITVMGTFNEPTHPGLKRLEKKYAQWKKSGNENRQGHIVAVGYR